MSDLPFPLEGSTLILGPTNVGKTRLTARALDAWVDAHGPDGVVILEFGPALERNGTVIGGRLDRFTDVPDGVFRGTLEAHAPRSTAADENEALALARENATRAAEIVASAPDPTAVFVNDATIAFGHPDADPSVLTEYSDRATVAVLNAYLGAELGGADHPVSRAETAHREALLEWADRTHELE